jgi:hypothetical protein
MSNEPTSSSRAFSIAPLQRAGPGRDQIFVHLEVRPRDGRQRVAVGHQRPADERDLPAQGDDRRQEFVALMAPKRDLIEGLDRAFDLVDLPEVAGKDGVDEGGEEGARGEDAQALLVAELGFEVLER